MPFPTPTAYLESMENIDKQIIEKAKNIDLVVFDVDGVLTDGGIYVSENGEESKRFFAQDGHGVKILQSINIEVAILSGRYSKSVVVRGEELGIKFVIQNSKYTNQRTLRVSSSRLGPKAVSLLPSFLSNVG